MRTSKHFTVGSHCEVLLNSYWWTLGVGIKLTGVKLLTLYLGPVVVILSWQ